MLQAMQKTLLEMEEGPIGPLRKEAMDEIQIIYSTLKKQTPKTCQFFDQQIDPIKTEEALQRALNLLLV